MIRDLLRSEIEKAVNALYGKSVDFSVSVDGKFGDYSSNVAMVLAKDVGLSPREVAEKIKEELEGHPLVSGIEIAPPSGASSPAFLNFTLSEDGLIEGLKSLRCKAPKREKKKIQVEFISANPTGELHIGHARSAFYGDALSNVLEAAGHKVEREYFINDSKESTQIKELGKTVLGKGTSYLTEHLKLKIKTEANRLKEFDEVLPSFIEGEEGKDSRRQNFQLIQDETEAGYLIAKEIQKDNQEFITKVLGIKFDKWFSEEKELRQKKAFEKTLEFLKGKKLVYEKDGALWLKTSEFGDGEDRVVLRSDGSVSYFLSDITYHINKFKRKYDTVIDIWGADHHGHVKRMLAVKKMFNPLGGASWEGDLEILISQMVTLKEGGETKKLSKRLGTIVLLEDLVKEIGLDSARWFYLQKSLSTHMEFDMVLAKERSQKNPVFYVQYAHARMMSILEKASQESAQKIAYPVAAHTYDFLSGLLLRSGRRKFDFSPVGLAVGSFRKLLMEAREEKSKLSPAVSLIKKLIQFPEVTEDTANDYQVQRITTYAYELASEFSQFYRDVKVIGSENEKELVALVALTGKTLSDALKLLGISAPEKM